MSSEWMKVMLEEIAGKKAQAQRARAEELQRAAESRGRIESRGRTELPNRAADEPDTSDSAQG